MFHCMPRTYARGQSLKFTTICTKKQISGTGIIERPAPLRTADP